jgi:S1-C subfamily serine protease
VQRPASVVAVDEADDLAVLHVDMRGVPPVRPLLLGESTSVRVGDPTLTIGNPFGVDRTLTTGIVSALAHQIPGAGGVDVDNVIQTDQAATAGNAGSPLLDAEGHVIGINSQLATAGTGDGQRLGFAVPIDTADRILTGVGSSGSPTSAPLAFIGIGGGRPVRGGVTVSGVSPGGPAATAGIRGGDVIQRVGGAPVGSISDVMSLVGTRSPGQSLSVQLRQGHRARTVSVALGRRTS